jgi:hypothetical protein
VRNGSPRQNHILGTVTQHAVQVRGRAGRGKCAAGRGRRGCTGHAARKVSVLPSARFPWRCLSRRKIWACSTTSTNLPGIGRSGIGVRLSAVVVRVPAVALWQSALCLYCTWHAPGAGSVVLGTGLICPQVHNMPFPMVKSHCHARSMSSTCISYFSYKSILFDASSYVYQGYVYLVLPVPAAAGSKNSGASGARTITIVFGIIGAFLGFFTLAIAILQYRFHRQRRAGVGLVGHDIEMRPQRATHEQSTPTASPP